MEETTFGLDVQGLQAKGDTVLLDPETAALRTVVTICAKHRIAAPSSQRKSLNMFKHPVRRPRRRAAA